MQEIVLSKRVKSEKELVGVDVFLDWDEENRDPVKLGKVLEAIDGDGIRLKMITNRGVLVYPDGLPETFCSDHWRCRYVADNELDPVSHEQITSLLKRIYQAGLDFIKTEHLYTFDGVRGYSMGQGE